jgi:PmbA protein
MGTDLLDIARKALDCAAALPGEVEVFAQRSSTTSVRVFERQVESLVSADSRGLGIRYLEAQRQGYAYTADLTSAGLQAVVAAARENASAAQPDSDLGLPAPSVGYPLVPGLWRPGVGGMPLENKVERALEAEAAALSQPAVRTVEESVYSDAETAVALVSSLGLEAYGERTHAFVYLSAHAEGSGDEVQTAMGFSVARDPNGLDPEAAGLEAAGRARGLLGAAPCRTGVYTVVLDRQVVAALFSVVAAALTAEAVQKGRSLFASLLGSEVAAGLVTLSDDGLHPDGLETSPFDDEGVPRRTTPLIEGGRLRSFLHNTYTSRKEAGAGETSATGSGAPRGSTGNAARASYRSAPGVSTSNLVVAPGEGTLTELFARVGSGLYVADVTGLHSGANPVTGEFSVGLVGRLIEGGAVGKAVREVTLASDLLSLLRNVCDRAADARWVPLHGSALVPSLAVSGVTVSGI